MLTKLLTKGCLTNSTIDWATPKQLSIPLNKLLWSFSSLFSQESLMDKDFDIIRFISYFVLDLLLQQHSVSTSLLKIQGFKAKKLIFCSDGMLWLPFILLWQSHFWPISIFISHLRKGSQHNWSIIVACSIFKSSKYI